jgi:lipopolysaccharide export system protein LptA
MDGVMVALNYKRLVVFGILLSIVGLTLTAFARAQTSPKSSEKAESTPVIIKSKTLEVNDNNKTVRFSGDVNAKQENFTIDCQEMLVYYVESPAGDDAGKKKSKVNRIVATGQVKITRDERGMATSDKAVYYFDEDKVVLSGKPVVRQGDDMVEGDRITIYLKENRSVVESAKNKKVRAVIYPKMKK